MARYLYTAFICQGHKSSSEKIYQNGQDAKSNQSGYSFHLKMGHKNESCNLMGCYGQQLHFSLALVWIILPYISFIMEAECQLAGLYRIMVIFTSRCEKHESPTPLRHSVLVNIQNPALYLTCPPVKWLDTILLFPGVYGGQVKE